MFGFESCQFSWCANPTFSSHLNAKDGILFLSSILLDPLETFGRSHSPAIVADPFSKHSTVMFPAKTSQMLKIRVSSGLNFIDADLVQVASATLATGDGGTELGEIIANIASGTMLSKKYIYIYDHDETNEKQCLR